MSEPPAPKYDRWSTVDPSTIAYGHAAGPLSPPSDLNNPPTDGPSNKGFYITTAINYTNGPAHMAHAYEGVTSDAIVRFARLNRKDDGGSAYFVTGADEHGEKIAKTAEAEGKEPIEICDKVSASQPVLHCYSTQVSTSINK